MNSSAAKRYLMNVVSVFSWGSDFGSRDDLTDPNTNRGGRGKDRVVSHHEYMNPEDLNIPNRPPPPRPPKGGRKSGLHYLNVEDAIRPPVVPRRK
jgi:hypothetical protein